MRSKRGRLDRFLAGQLNIPRKQARQLLVDGRVWLDDEQVFAADRLIHEFSHIRFDEQWLQRQNPVYWMLNKPAGVVSATQDPEHKTVLDCLPPAALVPGLHIAGRLDKQSTGLVLLSNDSRWTQALTLPSSSKAKRYRVRLANPLDDTYIEAFRDGFFFEFENVITAPAELRILASHEAEVILTEGKYHQIKRMFGRFRNPVLALHRSQIGQIVLDDSLAEGEARELTRDEVESVTY
ncbi:16S rRNA pseudouridine(516) synthase [Shewanella chilikensis]|uniref:16S rRNA pseudouridine(516) synthase n=1 Tax=Shewanella chilikensis TaxID=558541 RepID=UPI00399B4999